MADSKLSDLPAEATPVGTDIVYLVHDPGGTPVPSKATLANVTKGLAAGSESAAGVLELATSGETTTGTDTARATHPAGVAAAVDVPASALADHLNDTTDAHDASAISIADAGNLYTATTVEGALQELPSQYVPLLNVPVPVSGTSDTLASGDNGKINRYTEGTLVTVTLPTDGTDDLADGFNCVLVAEGAAGLTLGLSGITVTGSANTTIAQGEALVVIKTATANTWVVLGGTSA